MIQKNIEWLHRQLVDFIEKEVLPFHAQRGEDQMV